MSDGTWHLPVAIGDDWEGRHHDHSTEVERSWAVAQLVARNHNLTAILTDLIAELRDQMDYYPPDVFPPFTADDPADQSRTVDRIAGVAMRDAWTRAAAMATCAEQRLREVTGG